MLTRTSRPSPIDRWVAFVYRWSAPLPAEAFALRATLPSAAHRALIAERIAGALALVRLHAPVRYEHLRRDLPRLLVGGTEGLAACHDAVGICLLQYDFVVAPDTTPGAIALAVVHEGTHARLARAGFPYDDARRARIERLCATTEILFARRLPEGEPLAWAAQERLKWPDTMWSRASFDERRRATLESLGWAGKLAYGLIAGRQRVARLFRRRAA